MTKIHAFDEKCKKETEMAKKERDRLPEITEKIIESCSDPECFTHIDYDPIPSRENVVTIIHRLVDLMFPGYFSRKKIDPDNLKYFIGQSVSNLFELLSDQIVLSIRHDCYRYDIECKDCLPNGYAITLDFFESVPALKKLLAEDVMAMSEGDPAAKSYDEIIFSYPGIFAITVYRIANILYKKNVPLIPRIMTEYAHSVTGIDIHPGATIGKRFAIDHGTGVVIGETTIVGDNVRIYQGVTLGALSLPADAGETYKGKKRHPTIEDNTIIYSGATILGGSTVIGRNSTIGGNVWLTESVPPNTRVLIEKPRLIYK
jgi:serine O-acetyltransferase